MIGQEIGRYTVIAKLGEGGMGAVYLGEHALMGKQAAIKVLLAQHSAHPEAAERFFNEARSTSLIAHPGIVNVFDYGRRDDGTAFIVMELLQGAPLSEHLRGDSRLPSRQVAQIGEQLADALHAAHEVGVVHRDLKPDNIFLVADPAASMGSRPKILDFGIAKLSEELRGAAAKTLTGAIMGTPAFMSPEQCVGAGEVDFRTDIYSLGCVLYAMLAGRPPFVKSGGGAVLAAHITEAPSPVSRFVGDVDPQLEALIMAALAKNPAARPSSMAAFGAALGAIGDPGSSEQLAIVSLPALSETIDLDPRYAPTAISPTTVRGASGSIVTDPSGGARASSKLAVGAVALALAVSGALILRSNWGGGGSASDGRRGMSAEAGPTFTVLAIDAGIDAVSEATAPATEDDPESTDGARAERKPGSASAKKSGTRRGVDKTEKVESPVPPAAGWGELAP